MGTIALFTRADTWAVSRYRTFGRHRLQEVVGRPGLEPGTNALKGRCSTD
jgi:hypothetical protein